MTDQQIVHTMAMLGGSFIQKLAEAWQVADSVNQAKLKAAFAEEWDTYRELTELRAR
jgi:hypothetical protein